jgi:hypothetical protein
MQSLLICKDSPRLVKVENCQVGYRAWFVKMGRSHMQMVRLEVEAENPGL